MPGSYKIDTTGIEYEVAKTTMPKLDMNGAQKIDTMTKLPVFVVELTAWQGENEGAETLAVSIASTTPPVLRWREPVEVIDLEIIPWAQKGRNGELRQGVAFRAKEIRPLNVTGQPAPVTA
jgi:hypothetical protein